MGDAIYVGHDAQLTVEIRAKSGSPVDLNALGINRAQLTIAGKTVDSDAYPASFDWVSESGAGRITIDLTGFSFPAGSYGVRLVIYHPAAPSGVLVADGYPVNIGKSIPGIEPSTADLDSLRTLLGSDNTGKGSDLIVHTTVGNTVTQVLDSLIMESTRLKVSAADSSHGYLEDKVSVGTGLNVQTDTDGSGNQLVTLSSKGLSAVNVSDGAPGYLSDKVSVGDNLQKATTDVVTLDTKFRGALVGASSAQTIADSTWTTVTGLDTEEYDTEDVHDLAANTERLTIPQGVAYASLTAQLSFATNATGNRGVRILKNGATIPNIRCVNIKPATLAGYDVTQLSTPVLTVSQNDYFTMQAYQNSTAALDTVGGECWLSLEIKQ